MSGLIELAIDDAREAYASHIQRNMVTRGPMSHARRTQVLTDALKKYEAALRAHFAKAEEPTP